MVPEPQYSEAMLFQPGIAASVPSVFKVLSSVNFEHEPPRKTGEVDDVGTDWDLAPKPRA